ncbi:putative beat protein [Operophtera brumata]|uniref:Putative beat protein n=1 Tax=Operophtera brumata TaxID=104452 RepID=A0A0L7LVJ9_OPEBR|nr:putative beat protein [Operophtera brumata]
MHRRLSGDYQCEQSADTPLFHTDIRSAPLTVVRISSMHRRLSGDYQCEVSADAPLFHTDIRSAPLTVVDPPFRAPQIVLSRDSYARGDIIRANCSVDESYPAPNITWILDDHKNL